jgi:hypothetical protein
MNEKPGQIRFCRGFAFSVGRVGVEPTFPRETDFKSVAYANSATAPDGMDNCSALGGFVKWILMEMALALFPGLLL